MYTGIETSTFRTGLNTGHTGHVLTILANFGQYQPILGVLANTGKSFILFFILFLSFVIFEFLLG